MARLAIRALVMVALAAVAVPGHAAVTLIGSGLGRDCFEAADRRQEARSAIETCTRALDEETLTRRDRAATLVNRGIIRMQAKNLEGALADYEAALKVDDNLAEAHVNRGIALLHKGGHDRDAIAALTQGLAMKPSRPEVALYTRAVAYELTGDVRQAFEDYQAAAAAKPGWVDPVEQLKRFSVERRKTDRG
jgi:tetratricopeptide (TPR) repeat protein